MIPTITCYPSRIDFDLMTPDPADVRIEDIAHSLSMLCRFNGHCSEFYSVAQHSVMVAQLIERDEALPSCPDRVVLAALLHDAAEAYIGDVCTPLKRELMVNDVMTLGTMEHRIQRAIHKALRVGCLPTWAHSGIKKADRRAVSREVRDLKGHLDPGMYPQWRHLDKVEPWEKRIVPLPPQAAERVFLAMFRRLTV